MSDPQRAEEQLATYRRQTRFVRLLGAPIPVTQWLLGVNLAVFLLLHLFAYARADGYHDGVPYQMMLLLGAKLNLAINDGAVWRLVSSQFMHGNLLHIAFNAYAIFVLAPMVERLFGSRRLLVIYGLAGLTGALASYAFSTAPSVGASGAIFGLLGAVTYFGVRYREALPEGVGRRIVRSVGPWVVLNLALGLMIPSVDNAAHVGGLLGGLLAVRLIGSQVSDRPERASTRWIAVGIVGAWLLSGIALLAEAAHCGRSFEQMEICYVDYLTPVETGDQDDTP